MSVSRKPPQPTHKDQCRENQADDKQHQWHQHRDVRGQKLETVTSFTYLGCGITDEGSKPEIRSRTAQTAAALTRFKPVWNDRSISLSSNIKLMRSLVTSIFLYVVSHGPSQQSCKEEYKPWK